MLWHGVFVYTYKIQLNYQLAYCMKTVNTKIIINNVLNNDICDASNNWMCQ